MIHLDTHVVLWLADGQADRFPPAAVRAIDAHDLVISPMVLLELDYLREVGRTRLPARDIFAAVTARTGLRLSTASFSAVVEAASSLGWTRDPFDRLIAAQAIADGCGLLTRDVSIRGHMPGAVWD